MFVLYNKRNSIDFPKKKRGIGTDSAFFLVLVQGI